jgi:hypothetical protein
MNSLYVGKRKIFRREITGCDTLQFDRRLLTFWRIILPPPSGSKSKALYQNTRLHIPEDRTLHKHSRENLKSHGVWFDFISDLRRTLVNNIWTCIQ